MYERMVYSTHKGKRYGPYGPYNYRSEREGDKVHSIYVGPASGRSSVGKPTGYEKPEVYTRSTDTPRGLNASSDTVVRGDKKMQEPPHEKGTNVFFGDHPEWLPGKKVTFNGKRIRVTRVVTQTEKAVLVEGDAGALWGGILQMWLPKSALASNWGKQGEVVQP